MDLKKKPDGFTLIEILVVVTIIITVFGFAAPTIGRILSNRKIKSVTGRLVDVLSSARTDAITNHRSVYVFFMQDRLVSVPERLGKAEYTKYFSSEKEKAKMTIDLQFAGERIKHTPETVENPSGLETRLPPCPERDWSKPVSARAVLRKLQKEYHEAPKAYIVFKTDGTVEFGSAGGPGNKLSLEFWKDRPTGADIVVHERGNEVYGWIDVRVTGSVEEKIEEPAEGFAVSDNTSASS